MSQSEEDFKPPPRAVTTDGDFAQSPIATHGISINFPKAVPRPTPHHHMTAPAYHSPLRHHQRTPSRSKEVKETLDARTQYGSNDDDGSALHKINQYVIKQEIGRGSFGAVHLAIDQYGNEYAVKEFSKSRLRKRAQSSLLRRPQPGGGRRPGRFGGYPSPMHSINPSTLREPQPKNNSLDLIKEEIAIMKKLDHPNLVSLIEVLDDPSEDSLYMVLEMCKKGVVMKLSVIDSPPTGDSSDDHHNPHCAEPYPDHICRTWFRDLLLGIEYLHAQGIIHRDIKPDNCLITADDVLKLVDFGVSEMFDKTPSSESADNSKDGDNDSLKTAKSAGSPAFMPPELCVARHGAVSGRAADIWSMGVTLYCLRYGRIPFEKIGVLELYESIRHDEIVFPKWEEDDDFRDLMNRILEKDPDKRITMTDLRVHPWVTLHGTHPLLSAAENCATIVEPPTESEMNHAITDNMGSVLTVMKAVKRFKEIVSQRKRPRLLETLFGESRLMSSPPPKRDAQGKERDDHGFLAKTAVMEGLQTVVDAGKEMNARKVLGLWTRSSGDDSAGRGSPSPSRLWPSSMTTEKSRNSQGKRVASNTSIAADESEDTADADGMPQTVSGRQEQDPHQSKEPTDERSDSPDVSALAHRMAEARSFTTDDDLARGHARDPLKDIRFLNVGAGSLDPKGDIIRGATMSEAEESSKLALTTAPDPSQTDSELDEDQGLIVSESPSGLDDSEANIYETAYQQEMSRILAERGESASIHLTRRVEHREDIKNHPNIAASSVNHGVNFARRSAREAAKWMGVEKSSAGLADVVRRAAERAEKSAAEKGISLGSILGDSDGSGGVLGALGTGEVVGEKETSAPENSSGSSADASQEEPLSTSAATLGESLKQLAGDVADRTSARVYDAASRAGTMAVDTATAALVPTLARRSGKDDGAEQA